jgi:DNA-binding NarL/FixJ family response regulator
MSALILVVDDDPDARSMLAQAFGGADYTTLLAADGQAALDIAQAAIPDLIVLDAVMDGLSGFETCRLLKQRPNLADIPVIFMTGLTETEHVVEGFRAGGVDYITKPVVLDELFARVHVHLANAQRASSARSALDIAGRSLFAATSQGTVLWRTPEAARLLARIEEGSPRGFDEVLRQHMGREVDPAAPPRSLRFGAAVVQLSYLGGADNEHFFRLSEPLDGREGAILRDALGLTTREADVLVWIARGKSNRDISEILNISARTVNKHLEQVFTKLGVENRAAAAVIAARIISAYA